MIKKVFYGWWIVLACFVIGLYVGGIVYYGFTAFFEPLVKEFGWSYTQVSFAASLRGLEMGIFAPLIGFLVDRFGSRKLILCGAITIGFGLISLSMTRSLAMFYGSFMLVSIGAGGCLSVVLMSVVANWFKRNVGKALGIVACGFGASGLIVPLIVRLIDFYHWRTALVVLGFGMWVLGIPLSFIIRDKPEPYGYLPDGELLHDPRPQIKKPGKGVEMSFKEALRQRSFLYLMLVEMIRSMALSAVVLHVMPYLNSVGIPRLTAGFVAAAIPLISITGRLGFGWFGDIFEKRHMMAVALCLMSTGLLAFCHVHQGWVIFIFLVLFSSGTGGGMVLTRTILREYFGRDSFGKLLGIASGAAAVGGIIGPILAGRVFDILKSYHLIWLAYCGTCGLSTWMILRIKPVTKTDKPIPLLQGIKL
jgi:MFS transporter, OFA family, oxalate/formate antiporter